MTPGSTLACLDAAGGGGFEEGCEKALFATPERTAAAVSYVTAQLSLLAAGREYSKRTGVDYGIALAQLRQNAERDAYGVVAHVLATRAGCTATKCDALAVLKSPQRVRANLAEQVFDAKVTHYAAAWSSARAHADLAQHAEPAAPAEQVAAADPPVPGGTPRAPNKYFFPSANSIPAVSIMSAEPDDPPARNKTVSAEAPAARKSSNRATANVNANAGSGSTPARSAAAPLPLAPAGR